jgi:O-antigen/teichoic acid export membrane protein
MRVTLWLIPVAAIIAGAAPDIVQIVFGVAFIPAGSLLALLIVGAVANVMFTVALTVMTADGHPARTVLFTAPLIPLALVGHLVMIPRFGQLGAALGAVSILWPTPGVFVFAKLVLLGMVGFLGYWWIGEFRQGEMSVVRSLVLGKSKAVQVT